jgi:hypothetical protein
VFARIITLEPSALLWRYERMTGFEPRSAFAALASVAALRAVGRPASSA